METVSKALASVTPVPAEEEDPYGSFDVILSAPTKDRDGEIIDTRAFDPLPDHIPFDIDHDMTVTSTVGSGRPFYDEAGNLRVRGAFASTPLAQQVRTLVSEGHVRTTSVTFISAARETKDGVPHITRAELVNGTFTPVPSNRDALVLAVKTIEEKEGRRNSAADQASVQAIHDASVGMGAVCEMKHALPNVTPATLDSAKAVSAASTTANNAVWITDTCNNTWSLTSNTFTESTDTPEDKSATESAGEDAVTAADEAAVTASEPAEQVADEPDRETLLRAIAARQQLAF